ncbi:MAG: family 10 glycosylhydrolase [Clostridium sp.]
MLKKLSKGKSLVALLLSLTLVIGSIGLFSVYTLAQAKTNSSPEFRSTWVSTIWNLDFPQTSGSPDKFKSEYQKVLSSFDNMNMNAVTFQVRPAGDAFYPSKLNPWSKYLTGTQGKAPSSNFDPLKYMVDETHKKGMEYHAWFNPYRVTESKVTGKTKEQILATLSPDNFARKNPDLVILYGGKLYLNPGEPKVQQFIVDTVMEVVRNYNVDGIHFDDYFYPYDASFKKDNPDMATYKKYGSSYKTIEDFRRGSVDNLIKNVNANIKKVKPNVKFGVSPFGIWASKDKHPEGTVGVSKGALSSYHDSFADTRKWVREGYIDYITPQLYWSMNNNVAPYTKLVDWWGNTVKGTKCKLYVGHAVYKYKDGQASSYEAADWKDKNQIPMQIEYLRNNPNVSGSTFFSLRDLNANVAGFKSTLVSKYYTTKVPTSGNEVTPPPTNIPTGKLNMYVSGLGNRVSFYDSKDSKAVKYRLYKFTGNEKVDLNNSKHILTTIDRSSKNYITYTDSTMNLTSTYKYVIQGLDSSSKVVNEFR